MSCTDSRSIGSNAEQQLCEDWCSVLRRKESGRELI